MPVPSTIADLSTTAASNSPAGSESPTSGDDYLRAIQAIIRSTNAKGADIASATTTDIGAATGEFVDVTGTTTITGLGTVAAGIVRTVRFTGALTLTHNAISLILPGSANITTVNGDVAQFRSLGSGNWKCVSYIKADGTAVVIADNSITTAKIADNTVTQSKVASNVVGKGVAISVYLSADQSISSGVATKVLFNTEDFDTNTNFASSRFTPTVAGYYQINSSVGLACVSAFSNAYSAIYKNGAEYERGSQITGSGVTYYASIASALVYLNGSTDYIEIYGVISATSPLISGFTDRRTKISAVLVRAA